MTYLAESGRLLLTTLSILMWLWWSVATAQCQQVMTLRASAVGSSQILDENQHLADAIAAALNQAISQARGVYVSVSTELFDQYRNDLVTGISYESNYQQEILSRFSGFVVEYSVDQQRQLGQGIMEVTVTASICMDARIAIGIDADSISRQAILNSLIRDVRDAGWHVIYDSPRYNASEIDLLNFTIESGVTFIAQGGLVSSISQYEGFKNATVTLNVNLIDTRTMQLSHSFNQTVTAVGATEAAALQSAGQIIGQELARSWNQVFLRSEDRKYSTFTFSGVRRAGTRYTLEEIVRQVRGVLNVSRVEYDSFYGEVRMEVELAGDPCSIARDVTTYRRVISTVQSCSADRALFHVSGD